MKARSGVDISITALEEMDPEVIETWHRVKGEFFTSWAVPRDEYWPVISKWAK